VTAPPAVDSRVAGIGDPDTWLCHVSPHGVNAMSILTAAAVLAQAAPMGPMGGHGYGPMGHGGAWGAMGGGWLGLLVPALLVVLLVVGVLLVATRPAGPPGDGRDDAVEALRLAYARGDLSDEEYERRRARLS
jgi:putative membrane protein